MTESEPSQPVALSAPKLEFAAGMFKMLGHPLQLQLVKMLDLHGEKTVNEPAELCGQPQPTVPLSRSISTGARHCACCGAGGAARAAL
jgi:hypothetical protein